MDTNSIDTLGGSWTSCLISPGEIDKLNLITADSVERRMPRLYRRQGDLPAWAKANWTRR